MSDRSTVLFVVANYPPRPGGAERHTQRLSDCLHKRGNRVRVLTARYPESVVRTPEEAAPVTYFPTPSRPRLRDVCFALWVTASLPLLRLRYRQVQWVMTGLQVVFGLPIASALRMKNIVMLAGAGEGERLQHSPVGRCLLCLMRHFADCIIILNSAMQLEMESLGFAPERLVMLGCEADPRMFRPPERDEKQCLRAHWKLPPAATVVTFAGRLVRGKGIEVLLEAFAALQKNHLNAVLCVAGDGQLAAELRSFVVSQRLETCVHFTGQLAAPSVSDLLRTTDVFTLPSESEGIPAALVEAMAAGLPSVVTDIPGTEILLDQVYGLRVPVGDAAALAVALNAMLGDSAGRSRMGNAAREFFLSNFTPDHVAKAHEQLYQLLLQAPLEARPAHPRTRGPSDRPV